MSSALIQRLGIGIGRSRLRSRDFKNKSIYATIDKVTEETAGVVERWFESERDAEVWGGELGCGRRGWHGQGWLGNGNWRVTRMQMDEMGVCLSCGEKLVSIDIDPKETENFTASLTNLVRQREVEADFMQFQGWGLRQQSATNGCQGVASVT